MAESAVTFLLNKLSLLLQEEENLLRGFRGEVVWIKDELERMRAFLRVADSMEDGDEELKVWVRQVRFAAYDTENVLDEFMLRFEHRQGNGFISAFRKAIRSIKNLKTRCEIASKIKSMKYRIENISDGHRRYGCKLEVGGNEASSSSLVAGNNNWHDRLGDALFTNEAELVGIEKPKRELVGWLIEGDSRMNVVSVFGMGGLGKTTLVKKVYDDRQVKNHFQSHVWINVSQSFNLEGLLKDIVQQLFDEMKQPVPERVETMNLLQLTTTISKFLLERRYVIVLDDVWNKNDWGAFKYALPKNNLGSRVLLTTRVKEVADRSSIEFNGHVHSLKPLSSDDSWALFCRKTFRTDSCPPHLTEVSKSIMKRCAGLPLAIVAISGVLMTKDSSKIDEWEMVHRSLGDELESNDGFKSTRKILSLGFNDLPYYLKSCFLYLSIFPEDYLVERMRLIRLWMAEGFVEEKQGKTPEEVADGYLNELLNRSMIQVDEVTFDRWVKTCRVHDLIREIILSKSKDQIFVAMDKNARLPEKVRCISIHNCFENLSKRPVSQLRSLYMFRGANVSLSSSAMRSFLGTSLKLLRVLDLTGAPLENFPEEICQLFNLRYLSLRGTKIKKLPYSIRNLRNLETLDLQGADVTDLPVGISKLHSLRHLLVYHYNTTFGFPFPLVIGFKAPSAIGGLSSLQNLYYVEANQGSDMLIQEIGSLSQLRGLGITKLRKEDAKTLCASIEKLCNLHSLSLEAIQEHEIIDLQHLDSPPQFLRSLWLGGRLEKIPHWIPYAQSLTQVYLRWSRLKADQLESLGALSNLTSLGLLTAYEGETLCFKAGGFQRLKELGLTGFEELRTMKVEEGAMVKLEELYISRCKLLKRLPLGIESLANLRVLHLYKMPDELSTVALDPNHESGDYLKIAHISEVHVYCHDPVSQTRNLIFI